MLNETEFAVENRVPATIEGDMADFAMFTIDLGDVKKTIGRTPDGKRIVTDANPHLRGRGVHLWKVTPVATVSITKMRKIQAEQNELDRQANLARYIRQGYAFDNGKE